MFLSAKHKAWNVLRELGCVRGMSSPERHGGYRKLGSSLLHSKQPVVELDDVGMLVRACIVAQLLCPFDRDLVYCRAKYLDRFIDELLQKIVLPVSFILSSLLDVR
jgi:hypothetical protein